MPLTSWVQAHTEQRTLRQPSVHGQAVVSKLVLWRHAMAAAIVGTCSVPAVPEHDS